MEAERCEDEVEERGLDRGGNGGRWWFGVEREMRWPLTKLARLGQTEASGSGCGPAHHDLPFLPHSNLAVGHVLSHKREKDHYR